MTWKEVVETVGFRKEIVTLASQPGANIRELCRRFKVSAKTMYKWIGRYRAEGEAGLQNRSRRPHRSPGRMGTVLERKILSMRKKNRGWGARKIGNRLEVLGTANVPVPSAIHRVLQRNGAIDPAESRKHQAWKRFEHEAPNQLWQMDFKGHMPLTGGGRCHPLTVVDDHSRYNLCLAACADEQRNTVQNRLELTFRRYGLPEAFFVDNGNPWGDSSGQRWTKFAVWLLKLGVDVLHSRPYHPQSRGKNERFHRTLKAEVFALRQFRDLAEVQRAFDDWRTIYNLQRPHQALDQNVPVSRFRPSTRSMPDRLPEVQYDEHEIVRTVPTTKDYISFKGRLWIVPRAFRGERVAIRPLNLDGRYGIFFAAHPIATIDLTTNQCVGDVSEQVQNVSAMSPG